MVLVQKLPFFEFFFLANIGQENVFYNILEQKNACLGYRNKKFKMSKNWHFSKAVKPWFWSKNDHYSNFFFYVEYSPWKVLLRYCTTKKRRCRRKIDIFSKGFTHGFCSKMAIIPTFFFKQYRHGKCLLRYFTTKKLLSRL